MLAALTAIAVAAPLVCAGSDCEPWRDRTGPAGEPLVPLDLDAALAERILGAPAVRCAGAPVAPEALRERLELAVGLYDRGRVEEAAEGIAAVRAEIPCLDGLLDPAWAWRTSFVAGVAAWALGDVDGAVASWRRARGFDPLRGWDDDFAPRGALSAFATALPGPPSVRLHLVGGPMWLDGRPVQPGIERIAPGEHALQSSDPPWTAVFVADSAEIVALHPLADADAVTSRVSEPERWGELLAVLRAVAPDAPELLVADDGALWRVDLRTSAISALPVELPEPPRRRSWGRAALAGGSGLLALSAIDYLAARPVAVRASAEGWSAYTQQRPAAWDDAQARYRAARIAVAGAWIGGLAGAVLTVAGGVEIAAGDRQISHPDPEAR